MAIYSFRTSSYARDIYLYGNRRLADIPLEYHEPVKQYAATNFTHEQIDNALAKNFISQEEYDQTMAYKATA
jgi:hypothetical protein